MPPIAQRTKITRGSVGPSLRGVTRFDFLAEGFCDDLDRAIRRLNRKSFVGGLIGHTARVTKSGHASRVRYNYYSATSSDSSNGPDCPNYGCILSDSMNMFISEVVADNG